MMNVWVLFQRGVLLCALVSFLSLHGQIEGLVGPSGILSIPDQVAAVHHVMRDVPLLHVLLRFPSFLCLPALLPLLPHIPLLAVAVGLAALPFPAALPLACLGLYTFLLALVTLGGDLLNYPWDYCLLEALFLAALLRSPASASSPPPRLVRWAVVLLNARLTLGMGIQKFLNNPNLAYWEGTYVRDFLEWQPMPTLGAWYLAKMAPFFLHHFNIVLTLLVEVPVAVWMFGGARLRRVAVLLVVMLQVGIALTGNFGIFQMLAVVLCIPLVTDEHPCARGKGKWTATGVLVSALAMVNMTLGIFYLLRSLEVDGQEFLSSNMWLFRPHLVGPTTPAFMVPIMRSLAPFFLASPYGIFRYSLPVRMALEIEGSMDGEHWEPYVQEYAAQGLYREDGTGELATPTAGMLAYFAPHQPRLDHMLFYRANDIYFSEYDMIHPLYLESDVLYFLLNRLFECSPPVLDLFHSVPFRDEAPALLRVRFFSYNFTSPETYAETGQYWTRTYVDEEVVDRETFEEEFDMMLTANEDEFRVSVFERELLPKGASLPAEAEADEASRADMSERAFIDAGQVWMSRPAFFAFLAITGVVPTLASLLLPRRGGKEKTA